jgi:thiol-disulfide isomerase/thioredoxin
LIGNNPVPAAFYACCVCLGRWLQSGSFTKQIKFAITVRILGNLNLNQHPMHFRILVLSFLVGFSANAQPGYDLQFRIKGLRDTTAWLGYYYGETTYKKDTALVDDKGEFAFRGKESLPQGVYLIALNKTRILEFVIGHDQQFKMETDTSGYVQDMKVTGSDDNTLFFENMRFNMERHDEAQPFLAVIQDSTLREEEKVSARQALEGINEKVMAYHDKIIKQYPNTVTSKIFRITQLIKIPDKPKRTDGTNDSTFQLRWYRTHFFDNFDLSDDALLRMPKPFYREKINEYLEKLYAPDPDTVIKAIDFMVSKAKPNPETYKYLVFQCILKYQNPDIMGLDKVFVDLYDKYFATGEMDYWANDQFKKNIKEHADRLRKSLIGNIGPNLIMQDINHHPRSMYDIRSKYTILYFFDPDCGHCRKETPKLVDFYTKNKAHYNIEVYAVSADTSMQKMGNYIKEMNMRWITVNGPRSYVGNYHDLYDSMLTPTVYVLDEEKKIIAKKISAEKLEEFLGNYEKHHISKTGQP